MTALIDVVKERVSVAGLELSTPGLNLPGLRYVRVLDNGRVKAETLSGANAFIDRLPAIDDALTAYNSALVIYQAQQEQLRQEAITRQTREVQVRTGLLAEDFAQLKAAIQSLPAGTNRQILVALARILHRIALAQGLTKQDE